MLKDVQQSMFGSQYIIKMEMPDGSISTVNTLEVDTPRARAFRERNKNLYYWSLSGMQKEIRRANPARAYAFAKMIDRAKRGRAKQYLRQILFEETRNFRLLAMFYDPCVDLRDLVRCAAQSRKDWEIPGDRGIFSPDWYRVAARYGWNANGVEECQLSYPFPDLDDSAAIRNHTLELIDSGDMEALYEWIAVCTMWTPASVAASKTVRRTCVDWIRENMPLFGLHPSASVLSGHIEELIGFWHVIADSWGIDDHQKLVHDPQISEFNRFDFPMLDYGILDSHTREGKTRHRKFGSTTQWHTQLHPRIEIRWTGAHAGTLWRHLAVEQHGTVDVPFEDVHVPEQVLSDFHSVNAPMK